MRRGSRRSFSGLLITIALHGGIFWVVKTAHSQPQEPLIVPRDFVQAEMVKLGKPRDKFWLPRVTQLDHALNARGIQHTWALGDGGHEGSYWQRNIPAYLRFYNAGFN